MRESALLPAREPGGEGERPVCTNNPVPFSQFTEDIVPATVSMLFMHMEQNKRLEMCDCYGRMSMTHSLLLSALTTVLLF